MAIITSEIRYLTGSTANNGSHFAIQGIPFKIDKNAENTNGQVLTYSDGAIILSESSDGGKVYRIDGGSADTTKFHPTVQNLNN